MPQWKLTTEFTFDSAHYIRDYEGPCGRMHGHTYKVKVEAKRGVSCTFATNTPNFKSGRSLYRTHLTSFRDHLTAVDRPQKLFFKVVRFKRAPGKVFKWAVPPNGSNVKLPEKYTLCRHAVF